VTLKQIFSALTVLCLSLSVDTLKAEENRTTGFGGPDSVENLIEDDARKTGALIEKRIAEPWFEWKESVQEEHGLSLGIDYSAVTLNSNETGASGDDNAAGGMLRFYGSWDLAGRGTKNTGAFIWKLEHRHKYTDVAPQGFGFDQGAVSLIEPPFSNDKLRLTNLYWRQRANDGKTTIIGGFLDSTDYVDVFALGSPWTGFLNLAFSIGTNTIYIPNDAAFGLAAGTMLSDKAYIIAGLVDAYGDPTNPLSSMDNFFDKNEYFSSIELGWTKSQDRIYLDNSHVTVWHVDESREIGAPSGWGAAFHYVTYLNKNLMPFVRGGYADDGGTLMQKSLSLGLGYQRAAGRDLLGVGYNWGEPNEKTFSTGLKNQQTLEVFYRFPLTEQFVLTPDIQYIKKPALNPNRDSLWVVGLRARLAI
jgi:porin